ncbi:MAG: hypothetical protein H7Z37_09115, partial [Pyrinomonadaceae bacterium]|nr:hypothetical protein [Pyrinomonadaceae bacterium]
MIREKKKIAIVTPDLKHRSGVSVIAKFLFDVINATDDLCAELISVSTSRHDANSVKLMNPKTWREKIKVTQVIETDLSYRHVGANLTEIELFRYRPRRVLDEILSEFDFVQIVAGAPSWLLVAENFAGKTALQVATLNGKERESVTKKTPQPHKIWLQTMNKINAQLEKRAFKLADAIFIENYWLKEILDKKFAEKTFFAPPGID